MPMSVDDRETGSNNPASERLQNGFVAEVAKQLSLEQKQPPLVYGAGPPKDRTGARREDEMSAEIEEKINPVEPAQLHQALGIYQSALIAGEPDESAGDASSGDEPASLRAMLAVKREFPDPKEFLSLSLRLKRFTEIISDKKLLKWGMVKHSEGGLEVHDAVVNALAAAPFRKSGVLDKDVFHELVKAEYTRLEAAEKT
jgi:hypothetical protein